MISKITALNGEKLSALLIKGLIYRNFPWPSSVSLVVLSMSCHVNLPCLASVKLTGVQNLTCRLSLYHHIIDTSMTALRRCVGFSFNKRCRDLKVPRDLTLSWRVIVTVYMASSYIMCFVYANDISAEEMKS